ncbi:MAG: Chromosome partition protein Smc [Syntrophorhabdus sp. PtaU1.Bin153]|nr:MAG: Chromosome partition protein Smc [Syntrophorhabdus sp. PtaU1.Bin153]
MNIYLLKAQWVVFGLGAPVFSWLVSAGLIVYSVWVFLRQLRESRIRQRALSIADRRLTLLRKGCSAIQDRRTGLSGLFLAEIDKVFNDLPSLRAEWQVILSSVISRADRNGDERFWITDDIGSVFDESAAPSNQGYRNASAIITGAGLLATFLAILVALLDVRLANNRIQGLDLLIQGLSGKFLSSVVAVACATALVFFEKGLFHPARVSSLALGATLRSLLPRLTPSQILLDSHKETVEQLEALRSRDAELAINLSQALAHTIEPALSSMAVKFNESLTGAAQGQFGQMSESLGSTTQMLQQMNSQLVMTGNVLNELVELAKRTAASEAANRQTQIEQMTGAVGNLMGRLQDHTGESMGSLEKAMAAITLDMSRKMTELSARMAAVIEKTSEKSTGSALEVLDRAGALASRNTEDLAALLERHSAEMSRVDDLRDALEGTLRQFTSAITRHSETTEGLEKLVAGINRNISSLAGITKSVAESQETAAHLLSSSSGQIASLRGFAREQQEAWQRIETSMTGYETMFQTVNNHAKELLAQIARHLGGYSTVTEKHFSLLTTTADNFISQATGRLSGSIDELGEQLDELHDAVNKMACVSQSMR